MNRSVRLALLGGWFFLSGFMAAFPSVSAAETLPVSDVDKEKIRLIVKEVLREYAGALNAMQGHGAADDVVRDIRQANAKFMRSHGPAYFKPFLDAQHPRATVIACSDSRVQTQALDATPDNDLFMIRNIGNQIATAEGSVEYGVRHLHTPLLLIVGHSACGAIKAAAGDYSQESGPIRRELDSIEIPKGEPGMDSIRLNVNNQVRQAMSKFENEVISGQLVVMGAVYDFRNDMKLGQGRLNIVNVNGETDSAKIAGMELMKEAPMQKPMRGMRRPMPKKAMPKEAESGEDSDPAKKAASH